MLVKTFALLLFLGFFVSCASSPNAASERVNMTSEEAALAVGVFRDYQRYRTNSGRKPLELNLALTTLAQEIAETRCSPEEDPQFKLGAKGQTSARVVEARRNLSLEYISESVYYGNASSAEIINFWANTPSTLNTLNGRWNQFGAGVATSSSGQRCVVVVTALKTMRRNSNLPQTF